ncbi:hypothetical protein EVAR_36550_1 [Eumeta japonica]|uniref:Uncharacterized protein n=1 Tax=Eumeta variegata TaxID=151549 RepID=A0A4C1Z9B7_EUMVA|nr:hypothetical protein EVAR_36550_1 [Eumeta japonica]
MAIHFANEVAVVPVLSAADGLRHAPSDLMAPLAHGPADGSRLSAGWIDMFGRSLMSESSDELFSSPSDIQFPPNRSATQ